LLADDTLGLLPNAAKPPDKPLAEELLRFGADAGATEIVLVLAEGKDALAQHLTPALELEQLLEERSEGFSGLLSLLYAGEELIAGRLTKLFDGKRRIIPGRTANATQALPGRNPCQYRNACWLGCPYGAYFSTQSSTRPAARNT